MEIRFADARPEDADVLGFIVTKSSWENFSFPLENPEAAREIAKVARFEGASGQSFLYFAQEGGRTVRICLLAVADGESGDYLKAGGELIAKVQTSGAKTIALHAENLTPKAAAEAAYGATLRNWRIDKYRTKLAETSKPSVTGLTVVGAQDGTEAIWSAHSAIAEGVALTKELVSEPANIIYPESFVERCLHLAELGVEIDILDDKEMAKLGMGALFGRGAGFGEACADVGPEMGWHWRRSGKTVGLCRQRRDLRYRRYLDQACGGHGRYEMGHGWCRGRCGRDEGARRS